MATFNVYYQKPEVFGRYAFGGNLPTRDTLKDTHVFLMQVDVPEGIDNALNFVYAAMQGERWSPRGEARPLIQQKGLRHTSMSVGDVIELDGKNFFWMVANAGFEGF